MHPLLIPVVLAALAAAMQQVAGEPQAANQTHHNPHLLKCHSLNLCSLGHVKPFMGDMYNSERS